MRTYTEAQQEAGREVYQSMGKYLTPIVKLDKEKESMRRILDITMRLVHNQPVTKTLTEYYHQCAGIGDISTFSTPTTPHSKELSDLVAAYISQVEMKTGNYVTKTSWLCWPLVAIPAHKSGTPPAKEAA